jgi:hypothetical protein
MSDARWTEADLRCWWQQYAKLARHLLGIGGLTPAGLDWLRWDLRLGEWRPHDLPEDLLASRALLLSDIAQALAELHGPGSADYYRGIGDLLAEAPDNLAELD